jgi:hypothetical protein
MPSAKKTRSRTPANSRTPAKKARRAKTQPLAITDAVMRQELSALSRSFLDNQVAFFGALARWSPAQFLASQQAAFWEGYTASAFTPAQRATPRRPTKSRKPVRRSH